MRELESVPCYICGGEDAELWAEENGFTAVKCTGCGLVYTNPRPPDDAIDEAARTGMHETERGVMNVVSRYKGDVMRAYRKRMLAVFPGGELGRRPIRWLDIGAGFGELVAAVGSLAHPDSTVTGLEPCEPKVRAARQRGLAVESRLLEDVTERYDFVSMMHVYSHLPDPVAFLTQVRGLLREGGELVLMTGNGGDVPVEEFPRPLYLPDHLSFAGEEHLRIVLERAGYGEVRMFRFVQSNRGNWWKNMVKRALGRPPRVIPKGRYRNLLLRAGGRPAA